MGEKYRVYKNSPICPGCDRPMRYLYTHLASHRSAWKCRECNIEKITYEYPEDDDGDPSKRRLDVIFLDMRDHSLILCA